MTAYQIDDDNSVKQATRNSEILMTRRKCLSLKGPALPPSHTASDVLHFKLDDYLFSSALNLRLRSETESVTAMLEHRVNEMICSGFIYNGTAIPYEEKIYQIKYR